VSEKLVLFFSVIMIFFLAGMEIDLFIPSYQELRSIFDLTPAAVQLTLSVNFVTYCIGSLYAGMLGDRYGTKQVIMISLGIFIVGSFACVLADNFASIVIGRALQGLGMAAPATLGYVVIAQTYSAEEQASKLGIINGFITSGMAFAPVIGSYINIFFGWRGNFVVLLVMGILCLISSQLFLPNSLTHDKNVKISLESYLPLMRSKPFWHHVGVVFALCCAYWIFIGMGPIIYMDGMQVPIAHFGFYQGALAAVFSIVSFTSPMILSRYGHEFCLNIAMYFIVFFAAVLVFVAIFFNDNPLLITALMCLYSVAVVFPINIMWPRLLEAVPGATGRASALGNVVRLIITAIGVELISYLYTGRFLHLSILLLVAAIIALYFNFKIKLYKKDDDFKAVVNA
jgi:DHA1 family bicyclomycin/chloramphenicol resistance-like MFS transporter